MESDVSLQKEHQSQFMKKHIANIITGSRIAFSLPLLFIPLSSAWFAILYLVCGLTDMVDGTIARKTRSVSKFGARLDTVADFVFMSVCCVKILKAGASMAVGVDDPGCVEQDMEYCVRLYAQETTPIKP